MNQEDTLKGSVDRFFFQSIDTGFVVFVLQAYGKEIIVQGTLPSLQIGQDVELVGTWEMHKKFGRQFHATRCINKLPTTIVGLRKYLGSGLIKGIGKVYAEKLVDHFGENILKIIDSEPERLKEISGIGQKRREQIIDSWVTHKEVAELMVFLQDKDVSTGFAAKIYKQYKHNAIAILTENPYRLAEDIWGIGFKKADEIAQKLGLAIDAPQRIAAGIIFAITTASQYGHLYCKLADLKEKSAALLQLGSHENKDLLLKRSLHTLYDAQKIKLITHEAEHYITTPKLYHTEKAVAQFLLTLIETPSALTIDSSKVYQQLRGSQESDIELNEDQQKGILAALQNKITIITGGPGTGKTTLIKKLLVTLEENHIRYKLAAPTGRAAKRILEGTGRQAVTLHRLLEFNSATMGFNYDDKNALDIDFLLIDEASMIDVFLAYSVLRALPHKAHLVLIGDIDQLPSVGAGNFLNDCIKSNTITCVRLHHIFRQAQNSLIVVNAHRVNRGEFPSMTPTEGKKDFIYIKEELPEQVMHHLKKILFIELPKHGINRSDAMILVPMNKGVVGTQTINHYLQELLNPSRDGQSVMFAGTLYKTKDKVMQIRNNYEKLIFNGDIGVITEIDTEKKVVFVLFDKRVIDYEFNELHELVLAYAISIHKSQGSEYKAVIIPLFMQHFALLQRNLIYTAITRAKNLCILIGQPKAIAMGINNTNGTERITFLKEFLQKTVTL